jgi:hypothetical protein
VAAEARAPKPGTKAALERQLDELRAQAARQEAELARLRATAPAPSLNAPPLLTFTLPLYLVTEANLREAWQTRHRRVKRQRETTHVCLLQFPAGRQRLAQLLSAGHRLSVHFVRRALQPLDSDGLASCAKGPRDEIAKWLGVNDDPSSPVTFSVSQECHKRWKLIPETIVEIRVMP